jgi:hypothetical protein
VATLFRDSFEIWRLKFVIELSSLIKNFMQNQVCNKKYLALANLAKWSCTRIKLVYSIGVDQPVVYNWRWSVYCLIYYLSVHCIWFSSVHSRVDAWFLSLFLFSLCTYSIADTRFLSLFLSVYTQIIELTRVLYLYFRVVGTTSYGAFWRIEQSTFLRRKITETRIR